MNKQNNPKSDVDARIIWDYLERYQSLKEDGYVCRYSFSSPTLRMLKLHHRSNGNNVILKADFVAKTLIQETNHILRLFKVYEQ